MKFENLAGQTFSNLKVLKRVESRRGATKWLCRCSCGSKHEVFAYNLKNGHTTRCAKCSFVARGLSEATHGQSKTRLYKSWCNMKERCYNPKNKRYKNYGGRGIMVCNEWLHSFETFADWAKKNNYNNKLTLDRTDVNGNYSPENCRWATAKQQANNATYNVNITFKNKTQTIAQWAEQLGLKYSTLRMRLYKYKMPIEKALSSQLYK